MYLISMYPIPSSHTIYKRCAYAPWIAIPENILPLNPKD